MPALRQLASAVRGAAWLVRAGGLRGQLGEIRRIQDMHARWQSGDLRAFDRRVYSQNGEDGIIQEILRRIGVKHRFFVEFGVGEGLECNCRRLVLESQWSGVYLESSPELYAKLEGNYRSHSGVRCHLTAVSSANIEHLLASNNVPHDFDVLSIDIDGNDYWVWNAIKRWLPRLVVIEYNATYPPPVKWVMQENHDHQWDGTNYHGASLSSLSLLGRAKGYSLVGTDIRGVNAFFVRTDLVDPAKFIDTALFYHYSPFNHPDCPLGHPQGFGPYMEI